MDTTFVVGVVGAVIVAVLLTVAGVRRRRARLAAEEREAAAAHVRAVNEHERWKDRVVDDVVTRWDDNVYEEFLNAPDDDARRKIAQPHFERYIMEDQERPKLHGSMSMLSDWFYILIGNVSQREQWELDWNAPVSSQRGQVLHYEIRHDKSIASVNADYEKRVAAHWVRREENERKRKIQNEQADKDRQAAQKAKEVRIAAAKKEWDSMSAAEKRTFRGASKSRKIQTLTQSGYSQAEATMMVSDFSVHVPDSTPSHSSSHSGDSFSGDGYSGSYSGGGDSGGGDGGGGGGGCD